ncbi:MAG: FAD-dependent monooxygenase [Candidatus Omnitrophica bacterium]|nr:FAD-dependent monooxygenase [Candidatus Omnitrophota bacterium]
MTHYDALVIGAGPAGIAAAIELSLAGWEVLLIDKAGFPRGKVCGGFVGPENKAILAEYGLLDALERRGAKYVTHLQISAANNISVRVPIYFNGRPDYGLGISRSAMDELLLAKALDIGVNFEGGITAQHMVHRGGHSTFTLVGRDGRAPAEASATHVIYANGGAVKGKSPASRLYGASCLFDSIGDSGADVIMHFLDQGHAGINRFEDGSVNVCYVIKDALFRRFKGDFDQVWRHMLGANRNLYRQMKNARPLTRWHGTFVDMDRPLRFFDGHAFYTGDASAVIHPVAGGGITLALSGGILLGSLLGRHHPEDVFRAAEAEAYAKAFRRRFAWPLRASRMIGAAGHTAPVANSVIRLLKWREAHLHQLFDIFHQPAVLQA